MSDAQISKVRKMNDKEWKAYKSKLRDKIKSKDKKKADKAAKKLNTLKAARKEKKDSKKEKRYEKLVRGAAAVKSVVKAIVNNRNNQKDIVNAHTSRIPLSLYNQDYRTLVRPFINSRAKQKDMNQNMAAWVNIMAEGIKKQNEILMRQKVQQQDNIKSLKERANPYVSSGVAKTNEFNEKVDIFGNIMSESTYEIRQMMDREIRENEANLEADTEIYLNRLNEEKFNRYNIEQEMFKLIRPGYDISEYRDSIVKEMSNEFKKIVDNENLTILSHPEFVELKQKEQIQFFNKISSIINNATRYGLSALHTINELGGIPKIIDTVKTIFHKSNPKDVDRFAEMIGQQLMDIQQKNQGTLDKLNKNIKNAQANIEKYKELSSNPIQDVNYLNIKAFDISNLKDMSDQEIDNLAKRAVSVQNRINKLQKSIDIFKQSNDDEMKQLGNTAEELLRAAQEMEKHTKNGSADPITTAYTGGATDIDTTPLEKAKNENEKSYAKRMAEYLSKMKNSIVSGTQNVKNYLAEKGETLLDKTSEYAQKYLPPEINSIGNIVSTVGHVLKSASNTLLGTQFKATLKDTLNPDLITEDDGLEITYEDTLKNLAKSLKNQRILTKGDDLMIINDLVGDYRTRPELIENETLRDTVDAFINNNKTAQTRLAGKGIFTPEDVRNRRNALYQLMKVNNINADINTVMKDYLGMPSKQFKEQVYDRLIQRKTEMGLEHAQNAIGAALELRNIVDEINTTNPEVLASRLALHQLTDDNTPTAAYHRLWNMAAEKFIGNKMNLDLKNNDEDKLRNKLIAAYTAGIHRTGVAPRKWEMDTMDDMINKDILKIDGRSIFDLNTLKDDNNKEKAWDAIYRAIKYRELKLLNDGVRPINALFAGVETGNTGESQLTRNPAKRLQDANALINEFMFEDDVEDDSLEYQYERNLRTAILKPIVNNYSNKMTKLRNQLRNPEYLSNEELKEIGKNIARMNDDDIKNKSNELNATTDKRVWDVGAYDKKHEKQFAINYLDSKKVSNMEYFNKMGERMYNEYQHKIVYPMYKPNRDEENIEWINGEAKLDLKPSDFPIEGEQRIDNKNLMTRRIKDYKGRTQYQYKRDGQRYWTIHVGYSNMPTETPTPIKLDQYNRQRIIEISPDERNAYKEQRTRQLAAEPKQTTNEIVYGPKLTLITTTQVETQPIEKPRPQYMDTSVETQPRPQLEMSNKVERDMWENPEIVKQSKDYAKLKQRHKEQINENSELKQIIEKRQQDDQAIIDETREIKDKYIKAMRENKRFGQRYQEQQAMIEETNKENTALRQQLKQVNKEKAQAVFQYNDLVAQYKQSPERPQLTISESTNTIQESRKQTEWAINKLAADDVSIEPEQHTYTYTTTEDVDVEPTSEYIGELQNKLNDTEARLLKNRQRIREISIEYQNLNKTRQGLYSDVKELIRRNDELEQTVKQQNEWIAARKKRVSKKKNSQ